MKNTVKRIMTLALALVIIASFFTVNISAIKTGTVIGKAQPTDIVATINGYQIESYNVDGYTYICVEDLKYYGFKVHYSNSTRTLSVKRDSSVTEIKPHKTNSEFWNIGSDNTKKNILYTDITTYLNNEYVNSSNVGGRTIINFNELSRYGKVSYDNDRREISLEIRDIKHNEAAFVAQLLEKAETDVNDSLWKVRGRAKGNLVIVKFTSKTIENLSNIGNLTEFSNRVKHGDIYEEYREAIKTIEELGLDVDSVYLEFYTKDGTKVVSVQIYG